MNKSLFLMLFCGCAGSPEPTPERPQPPPSSASEPTDCDTIAMAARAAFDGIASKKVTDFSAIPTNDAGWKERLTAVSEKVDAFKAGAAVVAAAARKVNDPTLRKLTEDLAEAYQGLAKIFSIMLVGVVGKDAIQYETAFSNGRHWADLQGKVDVELGKLCHLR